MVDFDLSKPIPGDGASLTDEAIEAFAASLEASVEAFRRNPPAALKEAKDAATAVKPIAAPAPAATVAVAPAPVETLPPLSSPAVPVAPAAPAAPKPVAAAVPASGLLAELRSAAALQVADTERQRQERERKDALLSGAMRQIWTYLNELARHLDVLLPTVPQNYRIGPACELNGLAWADSFADYRSANNSESAPLDSISIHYTLSAPGTVNIDRMPLHAARLREELAHMNVRYTTREIKNERGNVVNVFFSIERQVKVSLLFKAQYDAGRIVFRGKNFDGFGPVTYAIAPEAVTQQFLDDFGAFILGRPNRLLAAMTPLKLHE